MIVLGLTGSIGMGKSTAAGMLRSMGIPIHDSDASVHMLLGPLGAAVDEVGRLFPEALKQDSLKRPYIDRPALGRVIFADRARRKQLEDILHPMVRAESDKFKEDMRKKGEKIVALDIPLLFETGGENRVDVTICVTASEDLQRQRVLARPGMTSEKFERIVAGQLPDAEKRKRAHYVVDNNKGLDDMRAQLKKIIESVLSSKKGR